MLTDLAAKGAKPREKDYKLADSGGLYLFVTTKGAKVWRLKYRIAGKPQTLVLGRYPEMRLVAARELRDAAKKAIAAGRDPKLDARRAKLVAGGEDTSFERFAREWFEAQKGRWKPIHADDVINSMERDLFPKIGAFPVTEIDEPLLLSALKAVEKRGALETAHRLRQRAERVFKWARSHGAGNGNPAADVREAMAPAKPKRRWPALTDMDELRRLMRDVDAAGASPVTRLASRFMGVVAQRPGMVRRMTWAEVEGVDWDELEADVSKARWRVPADRMKQELELREDEAFDHVVPLPWQAVDALRAVRALTGRGPLPFCSVRDAHEPISENAVGYLYNRIGYQGRHVPHGWRSSFSTTMNARAAANRRIVWSRCLASRRLKRCSGARARAEACDPQASSSARSARSELEVDVELELERVDRPGGLGRGQPELGRVRGRSEHLEGSAWPTRASTSDRPCCRAGTAALKQIDHRE